MAVGATIVYSGAMSFVLLKLISVAVPLRVSAADEDTGLDLSNHGEEAYVHGENLAMPGNTDATIQVPAMALRSELA